jgi:hypothetical protein
LKGGKLVLAHEDDEEEEDEDEEEEEGDVVGVDFFERE